MRLLSWRMINPRINDRANGFMILILTLLILYGLKSVLNKPNPSGATGDENLFVQIEGDVRYPGIYSFCCQPNLGEVIERGGGLKYSIRLPDTLRSITFPSSLKVSVQKDGDGWRFFTDEISGFHKLTLGIPISLNNESEDGLSALPGIGPGLAKAIVRARSNRGKFRGPDDIISIQGIGNKTYKKIASYVIF